MFLLRSLFFQKRRKRHGAALCREKPGVSQGSSAKKPSSSALERVDGLPSHADSSLSLYRRRRDRTGSDKQKPTISVFFLPRGGGDVRLYAHPKQAGSTFRAKGLPLSRLRRDSPLLFKMKRTGFILIINVTAGYF